MNWRVVHLTDDQGVLKTLQAAVILAKKEEVNAPQRSLCQGI